MRKRIIGASVIATLAISLVGGAALAKPHGYEEYAFTNAVTGRNGEPVEDVQWDATHSGSFAINTGSDSSPASKPMIASIGFDWDSNTEILHCGLVDTLASTVSDNGSRLVVHWEGLNTGSSGTGCDGKYLKITATWTYDTHMERSTYKESGRLFKEKAQVDYDAVVRLTVVAGGETILDDHNCGPVGTYKTGEGRSHTIGKG